MANKVPVWTEPRRQPVEPTVNQRLQDLAIAGWDVTIVYDYAMYLGHWMCILKPPSGKPKVIVGSGGSMLEAAMQALTHADHWPTDAPA